MSANPDDELASATAAMQELGSLDRRLNAAKRRSEESAEKAAAARDRVAVEARDVERLESMSFTKILSHLKGSHDDDVARETAEHEAAQYEYLTLEARADADRRHVDDLQRQCVDLGDVTGRYEQALTGKERWLEERNDPASVRLFEIAEERGRLTAELTEIGQARDAGDRALGHLRGAAQLLDSARSWSAFDTWWDGGVATSMMKHERLDVVAAHIRAANAALSRFTTELSDVHTQGLRMVELGTLTRVFDVWFDNLFTDLAVRDRIIDAQEKVVEALGGVRDIQTRLAARTQRCTDELARLQAERVEVLSPPAS
jgi:hypothetical protein